MDRRPPEWPGCIDGEGDVPPSPISLLACLDQFSLLFIPFSLPSPGMQHEDAFHSNGTGAGRGRVVGIGNTKFGFLAWPVRQRAAILGKVNADVRWQQRFENYEKALVLLREALADVQSLSKLEKEGAVQRFEFTFELAWKTLKDYLVHQGIVLDQITPSAVIKQAFGAKIITDGQLWIDMLRCRNLMSHTYDEAVFDQAVRQMAARFLSGFDQLYEFLKRKDAP